MGTVTNISLVLLLMTTFLPPGADSLGTTVIEGDVYIELVSSIYSNVHDNGTCYDVDPESVQNVEAIRWVLTELNKKYISDGYKGIGLKVSETCRSLAKVENLMLDLVMEMKNSDQHTVIGVLGTDYSSESEVVSRLLSALPVGYRLPLVSWSSTSESLARRDVYSNFIRTIPSDAVQTQVMTGFMKQLNWTRMAIVHGDGAYGQGGKAALLEEARGPDICFPVTVSIGNGQNSQDAVQTQLMENIFNARIPISGILVFGHSDLADAVLTAVNTIVDTYPNISRPTLLFSEASGEIQGNNTQSMRGMYVLSPPRRNMKEFYESYANIFISPETIYDLPEPYGHFIKDVYFSKFGCELPASISENSCPLLNAAEVESNIHPSIYDQYAIQAALTMATIERNVRQKLCPGMDFCAALYNSPRQVYLDQTKQLSVNFDDFVGVRISAFREPKDLVIEFSGSADATVRDDFPLYEVYNHQMCDVTSNTSCIVKVAHLSANAFVVDTSSIRDYNEEGREILWPDISKPQCPDGYTCSACLEQEDYDDSMLFEPGDFYIVGVVPVHFPGTSPLQCGAIKSGMLDIVEAIRFAIAEAKLNYADKVPSGTIGTIIIDSCNDKQIVQERIISLHRLGVYRNGEYITVGDKILGYVGGFTSDVSATLADIATRLGSVQISYASTATTLSIRSVYPNFLRIPSSDDLQAKNILKIINEIGVNLIQIVYSDSVYGENGKHAILDHATSSSIHVCIAYFHKFTIKDGSTKIIHALNETKAVKVVVLFLSSFDTERLLPDLSSAFDKGEFVFISSDGWGRRMDVSDYHNLVGSVTLTPELSMNDKFEQHLKQLRPDGSDLNHWIRPYMESFFECYYEWNYNKSSGTPCTGEEALDVFNTAYRVDVWSPFAEKAVLALLQGSRKVLNEKCGQSDSVCDDFRNETSSLVNAIKYVTFSDGSGNQVPMFDENGDGNAGYKFYVLEMVDGKVRYTKIGASDPTFVFDLQSYQQVVTVESWCYGQEVCRKCYPTLVQSEEATAYPVWLVVMFVLTCIACIGLAGFLIFTCCRHGCCLLIENGRVKFVSDYISPVYRKNATDKGLGEDTGTYDMIGNVDGHVYMCQNCKTCISKDTFVENIADPKSEYFIPYAGTESDADHNNGNNAISNTDQKPVSTSKQDTNANSESISDPISGENYISKKSEHNAPPDPMDNAMANSGDDSRVGDKNDSYVDTRVVLRAGRSRKVNSCNSYLIGDICQGEIPVERANGQEGSTPEIPKSQENSCDIDTMITASNGTGDVVVNLEESK